MYSRELIIDLLRQGKIVYGVKVSEDSETGEPEYLVAEIVDLDEYEKNNYWDIVDSVDTLGEAERSAIKQARKNKGVYVGVEY